LPPTGTLITFAEFSSGVVNGYPGYPAPTQKQYQNLVSGAGPEGGIFTKTQLAMFLANVLLETGGLTQISETGCATSGTCNQYTLTPGIGVPGQQYYGRGYIQLTWDYNYQAASQGLYADNRLLTDPNQVATDDKVAWATAFWFWNARVLNGVYADQVRAGQFGATTKSVNGLECLGSGTSQAHLRFQIYARVLKAFNVASTPNEAGCYNVSS